MYTSSNNTTSKVQISIYASNLKNVAGFGKGTSDPYAIVTVLAGNMHEKPKVLGRTETLKNTLSPAWTTTFKTDFVFGRETRMNIGIFDEIRKTQSSKSMGNAMFEIGEILGARGNTKAKRLKNGGTVFVRVTKAAETDQGDLILGMKGLKLKNVDGIFSKSDPFFQVDAFVPNGGGRTWTPVYRSEHVMNDLNPIWKESKISIERLCGGNKEQSFQIRVFDWEKNGKHQPMGNFQTSINGLLAAGPNATFDLYHHGKKYGQIVITKAEVLGVEMDPNRPPPKFSTVNGIRRINPDYKKWQEATSAPASRPTPPPPAAPLPPPNLPPGMPTPLPPPLAPPTVATESSGKPTFIDYISGGTEINLSVAIDFTGSNGDPRKPGTLHYMHRDGQLNDYEKALTAVASIVARYDSDQMFPVYGFGAKFNGTINHCFQVGNTAEVRGINGMIEAYRKVFQKGLTMSGPTVFSDVIQQTAVMAESRQAQNHRIGKQSYSILLILTDGAVSNIDLTKQNIRLATTAPLSIVIVGLGNADFTNMQFLDDFHQSEPDVRDIVQFVEFNQYSHNKEALTRETLDEIPDQLVDYFFSKGIMPLAAPRTSEISISSMNADSYNEDFDIEIEIEEGPDGQMRFADETQATWNAASYGRASTYIVSPNRSSGYAPPGGYY